MNNTISRRRFSRSIGPALAASAVRAQRPVTAVQDVLQRALAARRNFIVSHECTFRDGFDPVDVMLHDPVCQAKTRFAEQNRMAAWRIHDHWHRRRPEPIFTVLARHIQRQLGTRTRPPREDNWGLCHVLSSVLPALGACDVALVGETPQHDTFEYLRDAMSLGMKKGLIMISHEGLEEGGMQDCAAWLHPLVPEIPVEWISSHDLFQVPSLIRN